MAAQPGRQRLAGWPHMVCPLAMDHTHIRPGKKLVPSTRAFRSPWILGSWPAARYTQSPCPCLTSCTAVVCPPRHRHHHPARGKSSQPSSKLGVPQLTLEPTSTSPPKVCDICFYSAWQSTPESVYVHAGTRHPRIDGASAGGTCQAHGPTTTLTG